MAEHLEIDPPRSKGRTHILQPPRWLVLAALVVLAVVAGAIIAAVQLRNERQAWRRELCAAIVFLNGGNRVMWDIALGLTPAADETPEATKRREVFTVALNQEVPYLECKGHRPVPVDISMTEGVP